MSLKEAAEMRLLGRICGNEVWIKLEQDSTGERKASFFLTREAVLNAFGYGSRLGTSDLQVGPCALREAESGGEQAMSGIRPATDEEIEDWRRLSSGLLDGPPSWSMIRALCARIDQLKGQLPVQMPDSRIQFLECPVGHGRLHASNWIDNGCQACRIADLQRQRVGGA